MTDNQGVAGRVVLVAGATSASGDAAMRALVGAGARVVAVGRRPLDDPPSGVRAELCDLADEEAVTELATRLGADGMHLDGILHLVGGWRGGGGLFGQTEADYRALEGSFTALRHVTRAFWGDLVMSSAARVAVVSSTAVARPIAGGANYAAVKAATEAWTRAVAQGFAKDARDGGRALTSAAVVFRVASLAGLEGALADRFIGLWDTAAGDVNDTVIDLTATA